MKNGFFIRGNVTLNNSKVQIMHFAKSDQKLSSAENHIADVRNMVVDKSGARL